MTRRSNSSWVTRLVNRTRVDYDVGITWRTLVPFEFTPDMVHNLNGVELDRGAYYVIDTEGDGNCALYALLFLYNIHNHPKLTPRTIRKIISSHVSADHDVRTPIRTIDFSLHSEFGQMSVADCHGQYANRVRTIKDYTSFITANTTFMTECELNVLHILFERPIVVCQPSHTRSQNIVSCVIQTDTYKQNRPMCLYYVNGNHYKLVISEHDLNAFLQTIHYNI